MLTSDLDWASEDCIEDFLQIARRYAIRPTLFVTHASEAVRQASAAGQVELGIHPNFLSGSDHGNDPSSVIDFVLRLVPDAKAVRAHRYIDSPYISALLAARGLAIETNLCRHLETGIVAEGLPSGLLRLPVFFEDDIHWSAGHDWNFETYRHAFLAPGLKVLNFHPFFVALNVPDAAFYQRHKQLIRTLSRDQAAQLAHRGSGARSFLLETIDAMLAAGHRFVTLGELAAHLGKAGMQNVRPAPGLFSLPL